MTKNEKIARVILIIYGGVKAFYAGVFFFSLLLMKLMGTDLHAETIWFIYMPILMVLGFAFLFFGIYLKKLTIPKLKTHIILSVLSIVWLICYTISTTNVTITDQPDTNTSPIIRLVFVIFGIIVSFSAFLIPQIIIGIKLYSAEKNRTVA